MSAISQGEDKHQSVSDADLIRRSLGGDLSAFDCLVFRYRAVVLNLAHSLLWNWDQAEDVAQQAFLDALSGLHSLSDTNKFRSWLLTITRRCAARQLRGTRVDQIDNFEEMMQPLYAIRHDPIAEDLRDQVKASLNELSSRNRTVLVLHYLDGYSCKEIGSQLDISTSTVKRILYESRNNLRLKMGVETRRKLEMPTVEKSIKAIGPRHLVWWLLCDGAPWKMLDALLPQSIFLAAHKKSLSIEQLAEAVDANVEYVQEMVDRLARESLLTKTSNGRYRTSFIAFDENDWSQVSVNIREQAAKFADLLTLHLPELEAAWNQTKLPQQGFSLEKAIWPVLGLLICNVGIGHHSQPAPVPMRRDSGYRYWMGGYEYTTDEAKLWTTEINTAGWPNTAYIFGCLYSRALNNNRYALNGDNPAVLQALAKGITDIEAIAADVKMDIEHTRQIAAELVQMGVVDRTPAGLSITFPIITKQEDDILFPVTEMISKQLYDTVTAPSARSVPDNLKGLGYGHHEDQFPVWCEWFQGNIAGEALRELLRRGILSEPGSPIPATFGLIGWIERARVMTWDCGAW